MRPIAALPIIALLLSPALGQAGLTVNNSVPVNGNSCDQILWNDAAGRPREMDVVQLAGNPGGNTGGYITRVNYNDGAANVTCNESGFSVDGTLSGLGQMVNHGGTGNGWVCSNLDGIKAGATTQVLFAGANHAIYQVDMDEYGDNGDHSKGTWHDRWIYFVANGRDAIVESISYDFSAHVAGYWGYAGVSGQTAHDSRSPYCSFNWTGSGSANTFTESIDGIEYAVRDSGTNSYLFKTVGSSPFSGGYTFNTPAANIPYTLQWKTSPDREIGYVSTFDLTQFAAGGGFTSAVNVGTSGASMPANWGINYQSNGFQSWVGDKMTWGVPYGAAGGTTGSTTFPDWTYARNWTGYPTMGYTIQIQLGKHSDDNVRKLAAEQAAIHALPSTALTAAVGAVVTTGKMNLQDAVGGFAFKPQGFNHLYNAWEVSCSGSAADVTLALGAASLKNPTFLFDAFTGALCQLSLNGVTQVEGTDFFSSVDAAHQQLYVTFNKALTGNAHIAFPASCGSPTPSRTASLTPTQSPLSSPTASPTIAVGGSGKSYCVTVNYAAAPALLNYHKVTLNVSVGNCASVTATEDGSPIAASYNAGTGIATLTADSTLASSSIILTAVGWTSGGTGAVTKADLYNNMKWAFSQTFDDGYSSAWTYGKPVLDAHGWRAGEAFVGSFVGQNWGADPALGTETLMTVAQWQAARAAGWDVYNHTYTHPNLTCANFQAEFDNNQAAALTIFGTGYHLSHIVYPFENSTPATSACPGFAPSYLISGEQNTDGYNYVDVPVPTGFRGTPLGNVYAADRSGDVLNATASGNLAYWEAKADSAANDPRNTWLIDICHRVYPANLIGNDTSYSNNVQNLTAFYAYLDGKYGAPAAGGNNSMWFAPSGEVMDYLMTRDAVTINSSVCGTPTPTPTVCGACTSTFTPTCSPTATPSSTATPIPACSGNLIDDLEDGNNQNAFGFYWYTYAGSSTINSFAAAAPGHGGAGYCAHAIGSAVPAAPPSLGTSLAATGTNASAFSGISFWFKGDGGPYRFQIHSLVEGAAYNDYKYDFTPPAGWSFVNIPWASFAFPGWGTAYSLDDTQISGMSWVPMGSGAFDFSVDDVIFNCPLPSPTPSPTTGIGSATPTRTPTVTATASPTASASPTVTPSPTASATPSASQTVSASPSATRTWSPSATPTATQSVSPTFTDVPPGSTLTNTPSMSPTFSATPSSTATATPSDSPSPSATASATGSATPSATVTLTPTPSASGTLSVTASPSFSPGPSLTDSPTLVPATATPTVTRTATPTSTATVTPTQTPSLSPANSPVSTASFTPTLTTVVVAPSATVTPAGATTLGPLRILGLRPYPNPNAHGVAVQLEGPADKVTLRLYSLAETRVLDVDSGAASPGWVQLNLPVGWASGLRNGVYYVRATAYRGAVASAPTAPARLVLLR